jgi:hypothetical protein
LGERYWRLVRRRGKQRALGAIEHPILVVVWHLLADRNARFVDLGSDFYEKRVNKERRTRDLVRQLMALGTRSASARPPEHRGLRPERAPPAPGSRAPKSADWGAVVFASEDRDRGPISVGSLPPASGTIWHCRANEPPSPGGSEGE